MKAKQIEQALWYRSREFGTDYWERITDWWWELRNDQTYSDSTYDDWILALEEVLDELHN